MKVIIEAINEKLPLDGENKSPTYYAILGGDIETFRLLYGFETEINPIHSGGYAKRTLLHLAVREENYLIVKTILEKLPIGQKNPANRLVHVLLSRFHPDFILILS